jgi:hypothetical protein
MIQAAFNPSTRVRVLLSIAMVVAVIVLLCGFFQGGAVTSLTYNPAQPVLNNVTAAGPSSAIPNFGLASHWLRYCTDVNATAIVLQLEASNDGTTWSAISQQAIDVGCGILEAGGYYPYVRANLITLTGASAHVTAWYSGSAFPIASGGLAYANRPSTKVSFLPAIGFRNNAVSSTFVSVSANPGVVLGCEIYNPNAGTVFVVIRDATQTVATATIVSAVAATSPGACDFPPHGVNFAQSIEVACSTSATVATAPASGCIINLYFKGVPSTSSSVTGGGGVTGTQPVVDPARDTPDSTRGMRYLQ